MNIIAVWLKRRKEREKKMADAADSRKMARLACEALEDKKATDVKSSVLRRFLRWQISS